MSLAIVINALSAGVFVGALTWALAWGLACGVPKLRFGGAFADLVSTVAGETARRELRAAERDLTMLAVAACASVIACLVVLVYGSPRFTGVWMWVLFGLACALFVTWWV